MPVRPGSDDHVLRFAENDACPPAVEVEALRCWMRSWEHRDSTRCVLVGLHAGGPRGLGEARLHATLDLLCELGVEPPRLRLGPAFIPAPASTGVYRSDPRDGVWIRLVDPPHATGAPPSATR